ncbi:hypothetical protein BsWGS_27113 [Bradybaena similaris]
MRRMCCLVAVLLMSSVLGHGSGTAREDVDSELSMDAINNARRQATTLCGRRPALSFRRAGHEGFEEDADVLDKIAGGSAVRRGEIPWLVNIYEGRFHTCGGAIISEFWVLTTARCVSVEYTSSYRIRVGDHESTLQELGEQVFRVQQITPHDAYLHGPQYNLALIKIKPTSDGRGILFNNYVQPICLANTGEHPARDTKVTISGWGRTDQWSQNQPFTPLKAEQPIKEFATCIHSVLDPSRFTRRMLCLGSPNGEADVCLGDQGGPATYKSGNVYILTGIISTATDCAPPNLPIVLLSVAANRDWIDVTINFGSNDAERVMPSRT